MNLCALSDQHCLPCPTRLPSCVGLSNGQNAIPTQIWSSRYLRCLNNRTIGVESCPSGWFNPVQRQCVNMIHPGMYLSVHKNNFVDQSLRGNKASLLCICLWVCYVVNKIEYKGIHIESNFPQMLIMERG